MEGNENIVRFGSYQEHTGQLDHTSDMSEEEHGKFKKAFSVFRDQTDFENENGQIMLKYYVQMAFLEGWKKSKKFNIDVIDL